MTVMETKKPGQLVETVQRPVATRDVHRSELIRVMGASLYPGAEPAAIELALAYCEAAGLDPMQKPVHIVPLWDSRAGKMRDVIMPGVGLYRTNASRTGQFAGMTEPEFGPEDTRAFQQKDNKGAVEITFPTWCRVTVKRRLPTGEIASFTAVERWLENYATDSNKSTAPNAMWKKRTYGQLAKCAQAQALRIAFPELGAAPTAEEMEGKQIDTDIVDMPAEIIEIPAELLAAARRASAAGTEAYEAWWKQITREERVLLQFEHPRLKDDAAAADTAAARDAVPAGDAAPLAAATTGLSFGDVAPADDEGGAR